MPGMVGWHWAKSSGQPQGGTGDRRKNWLRPKNPRYIGSVLATDELVQISTQRVRLQAALRESAKLPIYRSAWVGQREESLAPESLPALPFLTKAQMRADFPHNFLGQLVSLETLRARGELELEHTSGTSTERLPVIFAAGWWNAQEDRALRLNRRVAAVLDEFPAARRAAITSPACTGLTCPTGWLAREHRTVGNTLFVNLARIPFLLPESELERMAAEITDWAPQFLDVSPVHGARFARFCEQRGIRFPSLRFVLGSYEFVSHLHRRVIERAFGVPVFNLYGSTETGHLLMEDEHGAMKASRDTAFLEVVETDARGIGQLIVTTLSNDWMPLVRYQIGDLVVHHARPYADTYVVHGRARDVLRAGDGTQITTWQVDQCFAGVAGLMHYELRQPGAGQIQLRYIAEADGPTEATLRDLSQRLGDLLKLPIGVQRMTTLLPAASGKFRLTLPAEAA
jgi:phenylacetate-CoA ligase